MKPHIIFSLIATFIYSITMNSQTNNFDHQLKWMKGWTNFEPNHTSYPNPEEILPTIIDQDEYLTNNTTYLLSGNVYVTNGATLTIQEGTIIRCDTEAQTSLVVSKGSKLIARGISNQPIIFTSNKPAKSRKSGDWGGIIIAGSGTVNSPSGTGMIEGNFTPEYSIYGGNDPEETTTIMTYVRIEYAGKKINASKELNGLSLYAAGKNSIVNNIMISHSDDDSYECFGGNINMNNLISYRAKDDDFDFTSGYKGELYNLLAVRHPYISDTSGSYALEIDGFDKKTGFLSEESLSTITIHNATFINLADHTNYQHTTSAISAKYQAKLNFTESKISGFANVIKFDNSYTSSKMIENSFSMENSVFNVHSDNVVVKFDPQQVAQKILKYNMFTTTFKQVDDLFEDPLNNVNPKFFLKDSFENYVVKQ